MWVLRHSEATSACLLVTFNLYADLLVQFSHVPVAQPPDQEGEPAYLLAPLDLNANLLVHSAAGVHHAGAAHIDTPLAQNTTEALFWPRNGFRHVSSVLEAACGTVQAPKPALPLSQEACRQHKWCIETGRQPFLCTPQHLGVCQPASEVTSCTSRGNVPDASICISVTLNHSAVYSVPVPLLMNSGHHDHTDWCVDKKRELTLALPLPDHFSHCGIGGHDKLTPMIKLQIAALYVNLPG